MEEVIEKLKTQAILLANRNIDEGKPGTDEFKENVKTQSEIAKSISYVNVMADVIGDVTALKEIQQEIDKWK